MPPIAGRERVRMFRFTVRSAGAALAYIMATQAALADLTAQDVWSDWKDYFIGFGYEIDGTEAVSGDTLTISDLSMSAKTNDPASMVTISMGTVSFVGNSDGSVAVTMPASMPIMVNGTADEDSEFSAELSLTQSGHSLTVSGAPQDMQYAYQAATVGVAMDSLSVDGKEMPEATVRAALNLDNVSSSTQMQVSDLRRYDQTMTADRLGYDLFVADPAGADNFSATGSLETFGFAGKGQVPAQIDGTNVQSMLDAGFDFEGTFRYTNGQTQIATVAEGDQFASQSSSQDGTLSVSMNSDALTYEASQNNPKMNVMTSELPFPVSLDMAMAGFRLSIPVKKSEEAQDFAFSLNFGDFTVSETIWSMFDPAAVLPRDPADLIIDLAGKASVLVNFFDPALVEKMATSDQPQGELKELSVNKLLLSLVGTELSGSGAFTFDNSDTTTFDGMPKPEGKLNLQLVGGNGLIDKLITLGALSDDDAMGARMMMGMFGVMGDGPDTLSSEIVINEQGHVLANGQRIK